VSNSSYDEDATGSSEGSAAAVSDEAAEVAGIESRLEELAAEMSQSIEGGPVADREALHDFAVSLVRERLPVAVDGGALSGAAAHASSSKESSSSTAANLVGYGVLLIPVGFLLCLVFRPVGVMLFFGGTVLVVCGVVSGLAARLGRPSRSTRA